MHHEARLAENVRSERIRKQKWPGSRQKEKQKQTHMKRWKLECRWLFSCVGPDERPSLRSSAPLALRGSHTSTRWVRAVPQKPE